VRPITGFLATLLAAGFMFVGTGTAFAKNYGAAGCGLGSVVMGKDGNQILASTTNGVSGNQTFGMTTGSLNCVPSGGKAAAIQQQEEFFAYNFQTLSKEIARGTGSSVTAFAGTLGCDASVQDAVGDTLRGSHDVIFSAPGAGAALATARNVLLTDAQLASFCQFL